jgi:hypothetical protein
MSYNIDRIEFISGELSIPQKDFLALYEEVMIKDENYPSNHLFNRNDMEIIEFKTKRKNGKKRQVLAGEDCPDPIIFKAKQPWKTKLRWSGDWSGHSLDIFKKILTRMKGKADLVLIWERGDSVSGWRVCNGVITEHDVRYILED